MLGSDFPVPIKGPSVSEVPEESIVNVVKNGQSITENPANEPEGTSLALIFWHYLVTISISFQIAFPPISLSVIVFPLQ